MRNTSEPSDVALGVSLNLAVMRAREKPTGYEEERAQERSSRESWSEGQAPVTRPGRWEEKGGGGMEPQGEGQRLAPP